MCQEILETLYVRAAGVSQAEKRRDPTRLKISSLLGRLRTNNLPPTFKPGDGGRGICTLLPYVHNRIRLEKVPPLVRAEAAALTTERLRAKQAPFPLQTQFSHL